jgi:hypothetical protein
LSFIEALFENRFHDQGDNDLIAGSEATDGIDVNGPQRRGDVL